MDRRRGFGTRELFVFALFFRPFFAVFLIMYIRCLGLQRL